MAINYSLALRGNPADTDAEKKYYATPQYVEALDINQFAQHIADHGCVYSRADIQAILTMAVDCIKELILKGYKVTLGDLGSFWVNLKSRGEVNAADFVAANNIKRVAIRYTAGSIFGNLKKEAQFNQVPSRAVQAATIKALNGEKTPGGSSSDAKKVTVTIKSE